jgi:hypothetical protein
MAQQIQLRRGTAAAWTAANPTLAEGEMGLEVDTNKFKIGTGTTAWNSLGYSPIRRERQFAVNSTNNLIYYTGIASEGTAPSASGWAIRKVTIDNSGAVVATATASGIWNNRETLTYS